ncbi:putative quinol monooxygenase [Streptomyces europaeiscabiei]|uniref:putative quinol monooxygenase n=1 Tax=Streptomyces europaeiscabiei TaxID=146819 RepID=UPI0029BB2753|nr:putative quinol monooxygenase [Streptomyces europaeiscabiei]MDX3612313.1 putative quinol monooxygenase [Streptomyces europaeiscabiei]
MTFTVVARYTVTDGHTDRLLELLRQVREETLKEPGCISYEPHRSADDESVFFIVERYQEAADFDHHFSTPHVRDIVLGQIVPLLSDRVVTKGPPIF